MKTLKFVYQYFNDYDSSKNILVFVEGTRREELVEGLISEQKAIAMYYFLKYFPDLSDEIKDTIEKNILEIEKISNIKEMDKPISKYLLTSECLYIVSENSERMYNI